MRVKQFVERNVKWIVLFICLVLAIGITEDVLDNEINKIDVAGYTFIAENFISDSLTPIVKVITQFGGEIFLIVLSIILFIVIRNKKTGFLIWLNLGVSALLNQVLKHIIQRPRPDEFIIVEAKGYSFPSGHSMVSAAFYGFLIYLIYKNVKNKYLKWSLISILGLLILLIGTSRIYLGVHYTSDVLGGFLISISYLMFFCEKGSSLF